MCQERAKLQTWDSQSDDLMEVHRLYVAVVGAVVHLLDVLQDDGEVSPPVQIRERDHTTSEFVVLGAKVWSALDDL